MSVDSFDIIDCCVLGVLAFCLVAQLYFYLRYMSAPLRRLQRDKGQRTNEAWPGVSVVLSAHNERENLSSYLRALLSQDYPRVEGLSVGICYKLSRQLVEGFEKAEYDEMYLVYTSFQSMLSQEVKIEKLLPLEAPEAPEDDARHVDTVYEPDAAEMLKTVVPDFIAGRLYSAACDSFASEVSARRSAMDSATKNAGEMITGLRLKYNRARQGAITQEITEIVAGAEH